MLAARSPPWPLARAGEDLFTNMASIGLSVEVAQAVPHRLKRVLGRGAYTLTAARRLASHQAFKATLRVDGAEQVVWTHQLNVANGGYHAGRRIARDAGVDDRLLVVYRLGDAGRLQVTGQTVRQVVVGPRRPLADGPYVMTREVWVDTEGSGMADGGQRWLVLASTVGGAASQV